MKNNHTITYLVGNEDIKTRPFAPYASIVCDFLNDLSSALRSNKQAKKYPDIMAFAFWIRKANIAKLKQDFLKDEKSRLGLGLVFHITPSNVPINFAFSFIFGLLSGNANIVRVPSKHFDQIPIVCTCIKKLLDADKYKEIRAMNAFVQYERNDEITAEFSKQCMARILWGGDQTIRNIRQFPIPERGIEIAFADRYSFCILDTTSMEKLDEKQLTRLAEHFYNDTYLMDQNACSSPHLIVWHGNKNETVKKRFWETLSKVVSNNYELAAVSAVDKYTLMCHNAIQLNNIRSFDRLQNYIYRVSIDSIPENIDDLRGTCGYFYEYDTDRINSIAPIINTKYQTLTYFGVEKSHLHDFVINNRLVGIDRIVPVGKALDIGVIWDGYDIVRTLSRIVDVQ